MRADPAAGGPASLLPGSLGGCEFAAQPRKLLRAAHQAVGFMSDGPCPRRGLIAAAQSWPLLEALLERRAASRRCQSPADRACPPGEAAQGHEQRIRGTRADVDALRTHAVSCWSLDRLRLGPASAHHAARRPVSAADGCSIPAAARGSPRSARGCRAGSAGGLGRDSSDACCSGRTSGVATSPAGRSEAGRGVCRWSGPTAGSC